MNPPDNHFFPFAAVVGQSALKRALLLNAVNPAVGGVLIRGEKGTAKSTTVRALAVLLPEIDVAAGCPYGCDPHRPQTHCHRCRAAEGVAAIRRRIPVVTLPLNATEDRVAGGIDFHQAVKVGRRILQPGLLARAHRGILYVDEVNLLDDHIVDIILDAAASGLNIIEREGISFTHPSRFILVGTMNPEEGELRPQFLDRFGLCADISAETDVEQRVLLMTRREDFDADPIAFSRRFEAEQDAVRRRIATAREMLRSVTVPGKIRLLIGEVCTENHVAGHRADLVIEQAARAMAAWNARSEATLDDLQAVAAMALAHRRREASPPPPPPPPEHDHDNAPDPPEADPLPQDDPGTPPPDGGERQSGTEATPPDDASVEGEPPETDRDQRGRQDTLERVFDVGETFKVKPFSSSKDRVFRRGSGRRSRTRVSQRQGRYVKSTLNRGTGDIAFDATLRAAAPCQRRRKNGDGLAVVLRPEDIREKVREKRIGNFLLFVVDASGSMGARGRMAASKGAVMSLLLDAYQKRDRVAMISFRGDAAAVNLPPTASIELAAGLLKEMPVGGRTPLSAGLAKAYEVLGSYLLREPTGRPIAVLITDGRANMALGDMKPVAEAMTFAGRLAADERIRFIVVDTESSGLVRFDLTRDLAAALNAQYLKIEDLKAETLVDIVKREI